MHVEFTTLFDLSFVELTFKVCLRVKDKLGGKFNKYRKLAAGSINLSFELSYVIKTVVEISAALAQMTES